MQSIKVSPKKSSQGCQGLAIIREITKEEEARLIQNARTAAGAGLPEITSSMHRECPTKFRAKACLRQLRGYAQDDEEEEEALLEEEPEIELAIPDVTEVCDHQYDK